MEIPHDISVVENKVSENIGIWYKPKNIVSKGGLKTLYFFLYIIT